jgi:hypothetical protein
MRIVIAAALLSLALPARAQEVRVDTAAVVYVDADTTPRTSLQKGTWSLSFAAPGFGSSGGTTEFGAWEMIGARTNLGLLLTVGVDGSETEGEGGNTTDASTSVALGLNLKRYITEARDVTPFLLGGVGAGGAYTRQDRSDGYDSSARTVNGSVRAGVGAEWFPVRRFSVSGHTGFSLALARARLTTTYPEGREAKGTYTYASFRSFTSALSVQIWC